MPNIRDVAKASGVSHQTVSEVMNRPNVVRPATRERVLRAMREMNYHPSAVARGLSSKRMNTLGVVMVQSQPTIVAEPYLGPLLDGILLGNKRARQKTLIFPEENAEEALQSVPMYCDGHCDGLLLLVTTKNDPLVAALRQSLVPFVVVGSTSDDPAVTTVGADDVSIGRLLTEHLLSQGHRRIAYLPGDSNSTSAEQRGQGMSQALAAQGLAEDAALARPGFYTEASGYERTRSLLSLPARERPTALFCGDDGVALGAMRACREQGVPVPGEMSVVGVNDDARGAQADPPLTTVHQPLQAMAERGVEMLLEQIHQGVGPGHKEVMPTEIIIRGSVAALDRKQP